MPRFCSLFFIFGTVLWLFIRYFLPNKHKNEFAGTPCAQWLGAHYAQRLGNQCPKGGHTMPKAWATFIPWFVRDIR